MDSRLLLRFYAFLLALFPRRYRDEFESEMEEVFFQLIRDAESSGEGTVLKVFLHEAWDLPRLALREQWLNRKLPRYTPPIHTPEPVANRTSVLAILSAVVILILPGVFTLALGQLAGFASTLVIALLAGIALAVLAYGYLHRTPLWMLPLIGLLMGVVGVYAVYPLIIGLITEMYGRSQPAGNSPSAFSTQPIHSFPSSGLVLASIGIVIGIAFICMRILPPLRPLYTRLADDWTEAAFLIYGAVPLVVLVILNAYRFNEAVVVFILLALGGGGAGFLRAGGRARRMLWLITAASISFLILGVAKYRLLPLQDWANLNNGPLAEVVRRAAALNEAAAWFWVILALLTPWLMRRRPHLFVNLALIGLWAALFHPIYPYIWTIFTRQEFRLNQFALMGVIGLTLYQARRSGLGLRIGSPPALYPPALALLVGSSIAFILAERIVDINTLSAALLGLSFYGLLGLWLAPNRWREGLPAALLLIATLPFGEHLQTFVGYPMRLVTAALIRDGLAGFGVNTIGVDTILVFENGISQVDLPCSGVKSLWTGGMFLLAATWIERRRFHRRWLFASLIFAFLLFLANLLRVAILVTVGQVMEWVLFAEMLHVPMGVLGFAAACAVLVWMLRRFVPGTADDAASQPVVEVQLSRPRWLSPSLLALIVVLLGIYSPRPQPAAAQAGAPLKFQSGLITSIWPFQPEEAAWLSGDGPLAATRWRFEWQDYSGSLLLITSDTWRAHHRPERCFEAYGLSIERSFTRILATDFPIREVSLSAARQSRNYTAMYWLQSDDRVTDDYATRIWSDFSPERKTWVLVTILFDRPVDPLDPDLQEMFSGLRQSVEHSLRGGIQ